MKLKRLSLFLALVMIISAFAGTFTITFAEDTNVWEVGGTKYATLKDAFDNRGSETTIYLTGNYTATETETTFPAIAVGETVTITSKGGLFTMTVGTIRYLQMSPNSGTLKFQNINITQSAQGSTGFIQLGSGGSDNKCALVFDNVTFTQRNTFGVICQNNTKFYANNVTFDNRGTSGTFIRLNGNGAYAKLTGDIRLRNNNTSAMDSAMNTAGSVTLEIENARVYEDGSMNYQRILKSQNGGTVVSIKDSYVYFGKGSGGAFEFQVAGTEAAPNKITINNSFVDSVNGVAIYGDSRTSTGYTQIRIENNSVVYGRNVSAIKLNKSASTDSITVTDSIVASGNAAVPAIQAAADTAVSITNSTIYSKKAAALISTASKTSLTGVVLASDSSTTLLDDIAGTADKTGTQKYWTNLDLGTVSAETADEVAAKLGYAFRVTDEATAYANGTFAGYYRSMALASKAGQTVYQIADYITLDVDIDAVENANGAVVVDMQGYTMYSGAYRRVSNTKVSTTFKNGTMHSYAASGVIQVNGGSELTLDNVDVVVTALLNNAPIVVTVAGFTVNMINGSTLTANISYENHIIYSTKEDTTFNIIDSTITKTAIKAPYGFTGSNNNTGMINTAMQVTIANSTIDFSQDYKGRIIYMGDAEKAKASSLTLINSNFIASCGSGPISWYNANTIHMYGNNTFTGGDRLVEFAGAGYNSLYAVENEDEKFTPSIDTENGAGIRTVKGTSGIRFISTISADVVAGLKAAVEAGEILSYSFGTVVMKADDLKGTTVDKAIAAEKKYVDIPTNTGIKENEDGSVDIFAALVNIKSTNLNTEFAGIAYIDITIQNGPDETKLLEPITIRIYSDYNEEDNARSITEVAKKALADVKTTSSNEIVDGFRYNNELAVGETYYVNGEAKVVAEGEKLYSAYNADQREVIAAYLA